uniref:Nephrocystin 3-like N-terminal domain-containing protein n=1 Tax=Bionectria ochroleuca TaxID=29856 RepID=A0A8H7K8B0_BIOOC
MEILGVAANVIAVVDLSAKISSLCVQYGREVKNAAADIERLRKEIASLQGVTKAVQDLLNGTDGKKLDKSQLETYLNECVLLLKNIELKLTPRTARKLIGKMGFTTLKWPFQSKEVDDLVRQFSKFVQAIAHTLQVEQTSALLRVERTILSIDWQTVLRSLPVAEGASYDSRADQHHSTCLPNTRVDLLRQIREWAFDPHEKPIFWLNGMAGTGKSTISRTIAKDFAQSGRLGASFFFKRGEADRGSISKFFTTIAAQLVHKEPTISVPIKEVIDADPYIAGKTARDQFDKLIVQPLASTLAARGPETLVVVVDALDECDKDEDIKLLIHLFSGTKDILCQKLRILVTSRPELPIRLGFQTATGSYQDVVLHEVPPDIIKHDLTAFFHHELTQIKNEFNQSVPQDRQLQFDWPGEERTQALVKMAIPLFIFAATVCRSLADRRIGHPNQQLQDVLRFQGQSHTSQLSATYQPILNKLLNGLDKEQQTSIIKRLQLIVGSIVLLGNPLPAPAISRLLNIAREEVDVQLDLLHSVLDIPSSEESPVRIFHLSFHDFLVDSRYYGEHLFWVDRKEVHSRLAICCLKIMNKNLRTDICNLSQPGTDRATVGPHTIRSCIQPETQYACVYWVYHQKQAGLQVQDNGPVYTFLERHFLHWLEALSLLGRATDSLSMIKESQMLEDFLQDAHRFVRTNIATINTTKRFPVVVFIDALDECGEQPAVKLIGYLKDLISGLPPTNSRFGIFFSRLTAFLTKVDWEAHIWGHGQAHIFDEPSRCSDPRCVGHAFFSPPEYKDHMQDIHRVPTELWNRRLRPGSKELSGIENQVIYNPGDAKENYRKRRIKDEHQTDSIQPIKKIRSWLVDDSFSNISHENELSTQGQAPCKGADQQDSSMRDMPLGDIIDRDGGGLLLEQKSEQHPKQKPK